ncbi:protein neprosin-like [Typha latifolia]|uniref:protein neprosin-like n=1 Tax=Typha latifolia TaxID=4733 RepID=UPI003C2B0830
MGVNLLSAYIANVSPTYEYKKYAYIVFAVLNMAGKSRWVYHKCEIKIDMGQLSKSTHSLLLILLVLLVTNYGSIDASASNSTSSTREVSPIEMEKIKQYLKMINKPAVKSIKTIVGDLIDCIPIHKQPAFDNPLLKNHSVQMVPSAVPKYTGRSYTSNYTESVRQSWNDVGQCPNGTVPIRRTTLEDVLRAGSLSQFGKKQITYTARGAGSEHEYAIAWPGGTQSTIYGTKATFNVWAPYVQVTYEFSLAQLWITAGSYSTQDLNTIEAGWQVYRFLYGDSRPRLFIYWTKDAYQTTGCYNHKCAGFVQTDNSIALGGALSPVSSYGGNQYEIPIVIWKDPGTRNWWMRVGNKNVGYWPAKLFTRLSSYATDVEWGGEIVNVRTNGAHTTTRMGSGQFAKSGFKKASYVRDLATVDSRNTLRPVQSIVTHADNANCYDIQSYRSTNWGTYFFYGGLGKNSLCR